AALPHAEMADYLLDAVRDFEPTRAGEHPLHDFHTLHAGAAGHSGVIVVSDRGNLRRKNAGWVDFAGPVEVGDEVPWPRLADFDEVERLGGIDGPWM
ncbi:MAG: hypothetical protein KGP01_06790, partial [Actinomycetales bacterium]|nr:hypothetical protein [Actinomycetales bacterium]